MGIGTSIPSGKLHISGSGDVVEIIQSTSGNTAQLNLLSTGNYTWSIAGDTALKFIMESTERFRIGSAGNIYFPGIGTAASGTAVYINASSTPANELLKSSSSIRYKTDVEDMWDVKGDLVYNLRPVWYRSLCNADRKDWSWYGLIAEEVAQLEPRLVNWTYLENPYRTTTKTIDGKIQEVTELDETIQLVPDSVQYDRLSVLLIKAIQDLKNEVDTLKAQLNKS